MLGDGEYGPASDRADTCVHACFLKNRDDETDRGWRDTRMTCIGGGETEEVPLVRHLHVRDR